MARGPARRRGAFTIIAAAGRRRRFIVGLRGRAARRAAFVGRAAAARALASVFLWSSSFKSYLCLVLTLPLIAPRGPKGSLNKESFGGRGALD